MLKYGLRFVYYMYDVCDSPSSSILCAMLLRAFVFVRS